MRRRDAGHDVIFLTVGDPDQAAPEAVIGAEIEALQQNRTRYSPIVGYRQGALRSPRGSSVARAVRPAPTTSS